MNSFIHCQTILDDYHQRSTYDSNCIEFWAPVTDRVIPNIIPERYWVSTFGNTMNSRNKKPFGLSVHRKGYYQYSGFCTLDGKQYTRKLHRVIMMTFCYFPGCENLEVNHIDSNRQNNNICNLEWCTPSENTIHGIKYGNKKVFGNDYEVILTEEDVKDIHALKELGVPMYDITNRYLEKYPGINPELIRNVARGVCRLSYYN